MPPAGDGTDELTSIDVNAVVLAFSKDDLDRDAWLRLRSSIITALNATAQGDNVFLRSPAGDETDKERSVESGKGTVIDIRCRVPTNDSLGKLTLKRCHELRMTTAVKHVEHTNGLTIVIQPLDLYEAHSKPGLAVFDMDSTLIQQEVIDELARSVGRYDQVAAVTEAAMRGELDFESSLRARVAELKGVRTDIWDTLKKDVITFTPGGRELVQFLRQKGWKTAVLSGGFTPLAYWVKDTLGLDYAYANHLATDESTSTLTGEVLPNTPIVGAALKRELLLKIARENDIPISHTIAVGDGSNDLLMMGAAGLGIAVNAKPKVQDGAPARLNSDSLVDVAYVLGYSQRDIADTLQA